MSNIESDIVDYYRRGRGENVKSSIKIVSELVGRTGKDGEEYIKAVLKDNGYLACVIRNRDFYFCISKIRSMFESGCKLQDIRREFELQSGTQMGKLKDYLISLGIEIPNADKTSDTNKKTEENINAYCSTDSYSNQIIPNVEKGESFLNTFTEKQMEELELTPDEVEVFSNFLETDNVNRPAHYCSGKYECIDVMVDVFGVEAVKFFSKLNAFKYIFRESHKNGVEDIKKAIWYLNKYLELSNSVL